MTRDEALALVDTHVQNVNLRKHHYAVEAAMRALAQYFKEDEEVCAVNFVCFPQSSPVSS